MVDSDQLFGSCACERNQYTVTVSRTSAHLPQVFFDNSSSYRRTQATPVTAWLRVPLEHYHSTTVAHFPDETHSAIKRTFHTPATRPEHPPTRRQFCGYCGTHLTAWNEGLNTEDALGPGESDFLDVTLGSLYDESLEKLEKLGIWPDTEESDEEATISQEAGGRVRVPERDVNAEGERQTAVSAEHPPHRMTNRGIPYFEELVEHSRFGRIKRQVGGHTSRDGTTSVRWEVTEIDGLEDEPMSDVRETPAKRQRLNT